MAGRLNQKKQSPFETPITGFDIKNQPITADIFGRLNQQVAQSTPITVGKGTNPLNTIKSFGQAILQAPQRAVASVALEPAAGLLSLITKKKIEPVYQPKGKLEQILLGKEPVKGIFKRAEETQKKSESILGKEGIGKGISMGLSPLLIGGMVALDLTPWGGGTKKVSEQVLINLAKNTTKEGAEQIFKKAGIKYTDDLVKATVKAKNIDEVKNIFNVSKKITPKSQPLQEGVDKIYRLSNGNRVEIKSVELDRGIWGLQYRTDPFEAFKITRETNPDKIVEKLNLPLQAVKGVKEVGVKPISGGIAAKAKSKIIQTKTIIRQTTGQVKDADLRMLNEKLKIQEQAARKGAMAGKKEAIEEVKAIQEERKFLASIKTGILEGFEREKNAIRKQIGFERHTKNLDSNVLSRVKEKYGIKEWSNAKTKQLRNVLNDLRILQKGDKMLPRGQVEALKEFGVKPTTTKKEAVKILGEISEWKQKTKSRFFNFFKTIDQKIDNVAGNKDAEKVKNILTRPREEAVAKMFKEEIQLKTAMKDMLDNFSVNNAKDRGLIMRYGEKRMTIEELKKATPKWQEIIEADKWFRKNYDELLESTNAEMRRLGYSEDKLIPHRQDYYTHAQELGKMWEMIKNTGGDISPVLEQVSEFTKPNRKFNPFSLRRTGGQEFVEDAGKAFEAYLTPVLNNKYLTESIIRHRAIADILAHNTLQSKNLNQFIGSLRYAADNLAGKTNPFDRPLMNFVIGRKGVQLLNMATQRFGKNRIIGNIGSALMQISGIPNSVLKNNLIRTTKGLLTQAVSPLLGPNDPLLKSQALLIRYGEKGLRHGETIFPTLTQKGGELLGIPFEVIEKNISKGIWRASFDNAWSQGFRGQELMTKTDEIFKSIVGSRAIGEKAMAFESGVLSMPLQFQLEVNTHAQLWKEEVFSKIFKDPVKATRAAIETSITLFLMNTLFEKTMGRTPLPDPIRAIGDTMEMDTWSEKVGRIAGEGLSSVAGGQFIANLMPENFKKKYFGRSEVGIYPGGIPIASALSGGFKTPSNFVYDFVLPYGGSQLKKILQGIEGLDKMGSYNKSGKLQFPINQNQWFQVITFGKYSTKEAKEYFDKQRQPLSEKQTVEYFLRTKNGENPQEAYNDIIKERKKNEYEEEIIKEVIKKIKAKPDEGLTLLQLWKKQGIISDKMEEEIINNLKQ